MRVDSVSAETEKEWLNTPARSVAAVLEIEGEVEVLLLPSMTAVVSLDSNWKNACPFKFDQFRVVNVALAVMVRSPRAGVPTVTVGARREGAYKVTVLVLNHSPESYLPF